MAKAAVTGTQAAPATKQELEIVPKINAKALSLDVGPKVIGILDRSLNEQAKGLDMLVQANGKKYEAMSLMTLGIVKAAQADPTIKLAAAFSGDRKQMETLSKQIGLALGFREISTVMDGDKKIERVVTAKAVARYFPAAGEDTKSEDYQRKNTFRANFATTMKACAQAAEGIILAKAKAEFDVKSGTLRISGPKVKEVFGSDDILLNENASQKGKGKDEQLTVKPSFTAVRALAGDAHDAPVHRGSNTRGTTVGSAPKVVDPETAIVSLAHTMVQALGKIEGDVTPKMKEALEGVMNAIGVKLKVKPA